MTDVLVYGKYYQKEVEAGGPFVPNEHWETNRRELYERVRPGTDSLWVVVSAGSSHRGEWRLLQRNRIVKKRIERPGYSIYGRYHLIGDRKALCNFDIKAQSNFEPTLRKLRFESNSPIQASGTSIANALEMYRPLTESDVKLLTEWALLTSSSRKQPAQEEAEDIRHLREESYLRATGESLQRIRRSHNQLSNAFRRWLQASGYRVLSREHNQVDIEFRKGRTTYRGELKVCTGIGSTKGIREALGQLLEYNYYPGRKPFECWAIVLDIVPAQDDVEYLCALRAKVGLPLSLGWQHNSSFSFAKGLEL